MHYVFIYCIENNMGLCTIGNIKKSFNVRIYTAVDGMHNDTNNYA